jgi:hypothetical protein
LTVGIEQQGVDGIQARLGDFELASEVVGHEIPPVRELRENITGL